MSLECIDTDAVHLGNVSIFSHFAHACDARWCHSLITIPPSLQLMDKLR